jgi:murein DD-endopeptidase MepM/ murein hydrolase activator NlpD
LILDLRFIFKKILLLLLAILVCLGEASAQKRKKKRGRGSKRRDAVYIKPTKIKFKRRRGRRFRGSGGRDPVEKQGLLSERYVDKTPVNDPDQLRTLHRPSSMLAEDTFALFDGEQSMVEVAEEFEIDTTWVKATEYYSIWDAYSLNPYRSDISKFQDTLDIVLFDTAKGQNWSEPVPRSFITSEFGRRGYRWHYGVDLELDTGDSILAVWDGVVRLTNWDGGGYGNYVLVRHYNGLETLYGHLSDIQCTVGQIVQAGDLLAKGGNTGRSSGPHLHFEVRYQGIPLNPMEIFDFNGKTIRSHNFRLSPETFDYLGQRGGGRSGGGGYRTRRVYYHRIRKGDTLGSLSRKYGVSVSTLKKLNGMGKSTGLSAGKRLRIR